MNYDGVAALRERLAGRLERIYGPRPAAEWDSLWAGLTIPELPAACEEKAEWDERDVVLISYGDQVRQPGMSPLAALHRFLVERELTELLNTVHILPFFPYSSDDGFSVIDYRQVDPALGGWADVEALGSDVRLMFDLVLNHVSRHSDWFRRFQRGEPPYRDYFIVADPQRDWSQVTRPRSLPLLTEVETVSGQRHVWTTFSADQVDLNFAEPRVLFEMLDVLLGYVARGARIIRLDAIAYLWKEPGTSCIHLPRTHEVVKLMRALLAALPRPVWLLTETNVPHAENVSYFGDGDEAHLVYQFSLPPLLLDAVLSGDASAFTSWLAELPPPGAGRTYFNFTASHDGIGVRPLEGLVPPARRDALVAACQARGGLVSTKRDADGRDSPYELNITYRDAVGPPWEGCESGASPEGDSSLTAELHAQRFLATQAIMLGLQGVPAVYFHSLVGSGNDREAVDREGRARLINRHKFDRGELDGQLDDTDSVAGRIHRGYRELLACRRRQPAFHPRAGQRLWPLPVRDAIAFARFADGGQRMLVVANLKSEPRTLDLGPEAAGLAGQDALTQQPCRLDQLELAPYQARWIQW